MPLRIHSKRRAAAGQPPAQHGALFGLPAPPPDWEQRPAGISLCMIVKNEERFLEQCLRSAADAVDEINVVDTGSTDKTVEIAQRFGARVEHREWRNDFGWARNEALAMATKRWVLQLDADEELDPESLELLRALKTVPAHLTGLWIRCVNASDKYRGGGNVSHAIVRIFPNTPRIRYHGAIHEFPSLDGSPLTLGSANSSIRIIHHGYLNEIVDGRDKYARNMEIVSAEVAADPEEAFHWYNYGMTAFLGGDLPRGVEGFERMWELCRKHGMRGFTPNGIQTLADIYTEHLGQPQKGLEYANECLKLAPRYANGHFSAGKALVELKRYDEAREMYERAIEDAQYLDRQFIVDDEVPAWKAQCEIGSTYVAQGDDAKAIEWFERGLANRPKVEPLRINYAKSLERVGRLGEAESVFRAVYEDFHAEQPTLEYVNYLLRRHKEREALEVIEREHAALQPAIASQMLIAAAAVTQQNEWGDGIALLEAALERDPANPDAGALLEAAYARTGNTAAVEQLRDRELALEPQTPSQFLRRFNVLLARGRYQEALDCAQAGLSKDAGDPRLKYSAAIACANLGRKQDALEHVRDVTSADGDVFVLAAYLQAAVQREVGLLPEALETLQRLIAADPQHVDGIALYAAVLESMERTQDAEAVLRSALPFGKARIAADLANLYVRAGRLQDAKAVATAALA